MKRLVVALSSIQMRTRKEAKIHESEKNCGKEDLSLKAETILEKLNVRDTGTPCNHMCSFLLRLTREEATCAGITQIQVYKIKEN